MKTIYVYGVMPLEVQPPPLSGIQNGPLQARHCGPFQIIYSEVVMEELPALNDDEAMQHALPLILQHERAISQLLNVGSVLPMAFGTLLHNLDALESLAQTNAAAWEDNFKRLGDCVEMGIRVTLDETQLPTPTASTAAGPQTGLSYMLQRKAQLEAKARRDALINEALQGLHDALDSLAHESLIKPEPAEGVLLRAIYLLPRQQQSAFHAALEAEAVRAPFLTIHLDGPFAPYHFVRGNDEC